jgi:hypothetical protein
VVIAHHGRRALVIICEAIVRHAVLLASTFLAACSDVDVDLLGQIASPCELGATNTWVDVTPPVEVIAPDPGVRGLVMDPLDASVLYATTHGQGIWRSADCGTRWEHMNTGINGPIIEDATPIGFAIDRFAPDTLYVAPRFGGNSIFWSTTAGVHWDNIIPDEVAMMIIDGNRADISKIAVDPYNAHHIIATSQQAWRDRGDDSGVLEGRLVDGEWQWTIHPPVVGMGIAQYITFIDERTWLLVSGYFPTGEGTWITRDAGASFQKIDDAEAASGWQLHRSPDGTMYRPHQHGLLRSTDGETWVDVFAGLELGGAQAITGDGTTLWVSSSVPDGDPAPRLFSAPEVPGDRGWAIVGDPSPHSVQLFVRDEIRDVLYSFNAFDGIRRLRLR